MHGFFWGDVTGSARNVSDYWTMSYGYASGLPHYAFYADGCISNELLTGWWFWAGASLLGNSGDASMFKHLKQVVCSKRVEP
jgi:hypothetical protein